VGRGSANECIALSGWRGPEPHGGSWNGLVDSKTGKFVHVAIPEGRQVHTGLEKPYGALAPLISDYGRDFATIISIRDTCTLIQISIIWHMEIRASEPSSCEPILVQVTCSFSTQYAKTLVYAIIWLYVIENIMLRPFCRWLRVTLTPILVASCSLTRRQRVSTI